VGSTSLNSAVAVQRQVVFCQPGVFLPGGVHLKATLENPSLICSKYMAQPLDSSMFFMTTLWQPVFL